MGISGAPEAKTGAARLSRGSRCRGSEHLGRTSVRVAESGDRFGFDLLPILVDPRSTSGCPGKLAPQLAPNTKFAAASMFGGRHRPKLVTLRQTKFGQDVADVNQHWPTFGRPVGIHTHFRGYVDARDEAFSPARPANAAPAPTSVSAASEVHEAAVQSATDAAAAVRRIVGVDRSGLLRSPFRHLGSSMSSTSRACRKRHHAENGDEFETAPVLPVGEPILGPQK